MKINLIGMILGHAGKKPFDGIVIGDDGRELDAIDSLDAMIMEYAKVRGGGESGLVVLHARFRDVPVPQADAVPREVAVPQHAKVPWDDLKVAFGIDNADVFDDWLDDDMPLPHGWRFNEVDTSGGRAVVVFRVKGAPTCEAGVEVALMLEEIGANTNAEAARSAGLLTEGGDRD